MTSPGPSHPPPALRSARLSVVIATRDRRPSLLRTLERLRDLPGRPTVIVVDNASGDGTAASVACQAPWATLLRLRRNAGAAARNEGVRRASTPYVAFCDDDSWWEATALARAAAIMDAHPGVGLVAGHVLVGPRNREDPVCRAMRESPLPPGPSPGIPVLGFLACAAIVRRDAFLAAGGFEERFGVGGEEALLAIDLAAAGWELVYVPGVVAHHHPDPARGDGSRRRRVQARNATWCAWLRRPLRRAVAITASQVVRGVSDGSTLAGVVDAALRGAWVVRERRVVHPRTESLLRLLESA